MSAKITWNGLSDTRALHRVEEICTESSAGLNQGSLLFPTLKSTK